MAVSTDLEVGSTDADSTGDVSGAGMPAALRSGPVYVDYNATTPVDARVLETMMPFLHAHFGNPSSTHHYGAAPLAAVERARERIAATP